MEDFNFFSPYIEQKQASKTRMLIMVLFFLLFAAAILGFHAITSSTINKLNSDIRNFEQYLSSDGIEEQLNQIEDMAEKKRVMINYYNITKELDERVDILDKINSNGINSIFNSFFDKVSLVSISVTQDTVTIEGKAESREAVAQLVHNLKNTKLFTNVHVYNIILEDGQIVPYRFSLECYFKDGITNEAN